MSPTTEQVRAFVLAELDGPLRDRGFDPATVGDGLDMLGTGLIDSFGLLELIAALGDHFDIEVDFEELDPEGLTILGRFCAHVAQVATPA